jgi:hypothetical protein
MSYVRNTSERCPDRSAQLDEFARSILENTKSKDTHMRTKNRTMSWLSRVAGTASITGLVLVCFTLAAPAQERGEKSERSENKESAEHGKKKRGEHDREGKGEHGKKGRGEGHGEESGTELKLTEKYDKVRNGARLILAYDAKTNSFKGTVENTTKKTLERVRVEVHLSNGKELGPTKPRNLRAGKKRRVTLKAESKDFDGWTAHPEVGNEEHGHGEDGEHAKRERGEHEREGKGEHGKKERGEHDREGKGEHKERKKKEKSE